MRVDNLGILLRGHILAAATILIVAMLTGCTATSRAPARPATTQSADDHELQTFPVARTADLNLSIYGVKAGQGGYPVVYVMLENKRNRAMIVGYGPGSIVVHAGSYIQNGPAETSQLRREIMLPHGLIVFDPPAKGWEALSADGKPDLLKPTNLPPGKYHVYATFEIPGTHGRMIESDRREYEVK
jgi:hypothetical protein